MDAPSARLPALLVFLALLPGGCSGSAPPRIILLRGAQGGGRDNFEVRGLDREFLVSPDSSATDWNAVFQVRVDGGAESSLPDAADPSREGLPSVLGSSRLEGGILRFEPTFPLEPGLRYRARLRPGPWAGRGARDEHGPAIEEVFALAPRSLEPKTSVERVYPTANVLPENQLKFYIHFSGPMRRGQAYEKVRLLDASGREVEAPFLELGEELWDPSGTRFTLFFDPGRIKRGVKPREELGPPLETGKTYALVIDRTWLDAGGAPLVKDFRKEFRAGAPDHESPDPRGWTITPPASGTTAPLAATFPEPLDHALLLRLLRIRGPDGEIVGGEVLTGLGEREWRLQPEAAWKAGRHELLVETTLEDLAGNSVGRPFEIDETRGIEARLESRVAAVPFEVGTADAGR